jgi:hypothetical protein
MQKRGKVQPMKPAWEWTETYLNELIVMGVRESLTLDYKRCDALQRKDGKIREISKDVSAFANSAGGTIVYGIIEDKNVPTGFDDGLDPAGDINKEWLEQVITSNIQQRIDGVRIHVVDLPTFKPSRSALIVFVPQSKRAPHMANDYRYYKRYNFESVPMEDYEVRDVSRRQEGPDLETSISLESAVGPAGLEPYWLTVLINVTIENNSPTPANHALFCLMIDAQLSVVTGGGFAETSEPVFTDPGFDARAFRNFMATHGNEPQAMPLWWKGPKLKFLPIELRVPRNVTAQYRLISLLTAPAMVNKIWTYDLSMHAGVVTLKTTYKP